MNADLAVVKNKLYNFFMGKWYPAVIAVIVTLGHFTGTEFYLNVINILLAVTALCVCDSIRPLFTVLITFVFQVSHQHSPASPTFSDYYFTGWRLYGVLLLASLVAVGLIFFIARNGILKKLSLRKTTLLIPALALSAAFLLNGAGSDNWSIESFAFGASQVIVYLLVFLLLYLGLSNEESEEKLIDYVTYIVLIISWMVLVQMAYQFLFAGAFAEGEIVRGKLNLGWVTSNPLGGILITFIPVLFYGSMEKKQGWIYFITATLVFISALATCSRNALIIGSLTFAVCFAIACIKGKSRRKYFIIALVVYALAVVAMFTVFYDKLVVVFSRYFESGMNDSGRIVIWKRAWDIFCSHVLFGNGFFSPYAPGVSVVVESVPVMAHNTVVEFLASTGIFGMAAYSYYRIETMRVILKRPTLVKIMFGMSVLVIAVQSLLDSYIFFYYTMFLPIALLAVICRIYDMQMDREERFFAEIRMRQESKLASNVSEESTDAIEGQS